MAGSDECGHSPNETGGGAQELAAADRVGRCGCVAAFVLVLLVLLVLLTQLAEISRRAGEIVQNGKALRGARARGLDKGS